jgi:hypothetical protein
MRIVAFVTERAVIDRILDHLRRKRAERRDLLVARQVPQACQPEPG